MHVKHVKSDIDMSKRRFGSTEFESLAKSGRSRKLIRSQNVMDAGSSATRQQILEKKQAAQLRRAATINKTLNMRTGGFLGIEKKFFDTYLATTALASGANGAGGELDPATDNCLNAVVQGDGESNRDGKNYIIKSLHFLGRVVVNSQANKTVGWVPPSVFIAIVLDTQTNGAQLNSEDVYTNPAGSIANSTCMQRNLQYSSRFRVLKTFKLDFNNPAFAYDGTNMESCGQSQSIEAHLDNLNIKVSCSATTGPIAAITDNSLHVVGFATNVTETANLTYTSRIRFMG